MTPQPSDERSPSRMVQSKPVVRVSAIGPCFPCTTHNHVGERVPIRPCPKWSRVVASGARKMSQGFWVPCTASSCALSPFRSYVPLLCHALSSSAPQCRESLAMPALGCPVWARVTQAATVPRLPSGSDCEAGHRASDAQLILQQGVADRVIARRGPNRPLLCKALAASRPQYAAALQFAATARNALPRKPDLLR